MIGYLGTLYILLSLSYYSATYICTNISPLSFCLDLDVYRSLPESRPALSVEVHGFVIWISTFVAIFCYVFFAFVPDEHLQYLGITYYPHKYVCD